MLHLEIESRLRAVVATILPDANLASIQVKPCPDPKFGDYQSNALMALAKERRMNPRQLATDVAAKLDLDSLCERVEVAGAGFLNFKIRPDRISSLLGAAVRGEHLFYQKTETPRTVVVDFSSPNVAKPMHVGHIRSTILGDCLARTLRLLGHRVVTDNHIGDWGTQFGKLLVGWKKHLDEKALEQDPIGELERLYKLINSASEQDASLLEEARQELVYLQSGDEENLQIWKKMIALSQTQFDTIYRRLGVSFDHCYGESFYNNALGSVVQSLKDLQVARESDGALVVFFEDNPELKDHPAIIQKRDGAANYATTDLATLAFRLATWRPDEIIYVTDGRQQLHFKQVFTIFRRWHPEVSTELSHVWFGAILGEDGKPFKTRSGETVKLADLLDESEERAFKLVTEKNPDFAESERKEIARIIGLGAVKYSDLLPNRQSDYVFSWDKMLALNGNTAPYLQYAVTRIQSIFRKLEETAPEAIRWLEPSKQGVTLSTVEELRLAKSLMAFGLVLEAVAADHRPNYLCNYLYELAGHFTSFYENCPVLKSEEPDRSNRLALCHLTGNVLRCGLEVLGIETPSRM
jgi:arginyl-tRNA synthetase